MLLNLGVIFGIWGNRGSKSFWNIFFIMLLFIKFDMWYFSSLIKKWLMKANISVTLPFLVYIGNCKKFKINLYVLIGILKGMPSLTGSSLSRRFWPKTKIMVKKHYTFLDSLGYPPYRFGDFWPPNPYVAFCSRGVSRGGGG